MADPSSAVIAAIREAVTDWSRDDMTIVADLNAPSISNQVPRETTPKPFSTRDLMTVLDAAALAKLQALPSLARLLDDITVGAPVPLENWIALLTAGGTIAQDQAEALTAIIHATEPDPAWKAQLSWAEAFLGRPVDEQDIREARP